MIDTNKGFTLVRQYDATPDAIWRAWTDPDEVAEWNWVDPDALGAAVASTPWAFSPWLTLQLPLLRETTATAR